MAGTVDRFEKEEKPNDQEKEEKPSEGEEGELGLDDAEEDEVDDETKKEQPVPESEEEQEDPRVLKTLEKHLGPVRQQLDQLKFENSYLKGALRSSQPTATKLEEDEEDELEKLDDEQLTERLRAAPARTVRDLIHKAVEKTERRVLKQASQESSAGAELRDSLAKDRTLAVTEFPELLENNGDNELNKAATAIFEALKRRNGGYASPGDLTLAARSAYAELVRKGRIQVRGQSNGNGNLKERVRQAQQDPLLRSRQTRPPDNSRDPLVGFSEKDKAAIKQACKSLGVSEKEWRKRYDESQQEDPSYGK